MKKKQRMDFGSRVDFKMVGKGNPTEFVQLRKKLLAMKMDRDLMQKIMKMVALNKDLAKEDVQTLIAMTEQDE